MARVTTMSVSPPPPLATRGQSVRLIPAYFVAELVGTFLLVVIGDGVIASYIVARKSLDLFAACLAFGVGAMVACFASARISGAHINPAASVAFALDGRLKWRLVPVYLMAQYLGGFLAALVLYVNYYEAISALDGGQRSAIGSASSTGAIFATYPASYVTAWGALLDQVIGTALLLFSLSAVTDKSNHGLPDKHQPLVVAFVIGMTCVAFSANCGAIFNPARDLAPRLVTALFGYPSVWAPLGGTYWLLAGVVGPHVGAILGVFAYKFTIGYALDAHRRHLIQQQSEAALDLEESKRQQRLVPVTRLGRD